MSAHDRALIADVLVLCLTRGMSLRAWRSTGVLEREWALYHRLAPFYRRILVVSYGDRADREIANALGCELVCNDDATSIEEYSRHAPGLARSALERAATRAAVVKTNQHEGGVLAGAIARELRAAGITTALVARAGYPWSRFEAWRHGTHSARARLAADEEGDLCRAADLTVTTTQAAADDLAWRFGLPPERFRVVPNFVVDEALSFASHRPFPPGSPTRILSAGRLEPQKAFERLVRAGASCRRPVSLRIIGEGPDEPALHALARSLGVMLELPGRLDHAALLREMAACDLYVQCSRYEGHPKTLLEAMAAAAPVIVTEAPGLTEVVTHEINGIRTDADGVGLAGAIDRLIGDPGLAAKLGAAASADMRRTCSLDAVTRAEAAAHRDALTAARCSASAPALGAVRWDPSLLRADRASQVEAWRASLRGFSRRLAPRDRAAFLLSLDDPLYQLQGPAAIEVEGGLHPKHRLMRYHDFFVERIAPGERVIDLGSGVGALAASIADRCGARVVGIEIDPANIERARAIASRQGVADRIEYIQGDIITCRAQGRFDVVVLSNVLEHLRERPALLAAWCEWYRPSRWLIRVPAFDRDWKVPFKRELGVEWRLDDTHELEYTADVLDQELAAAGLECAERITRWGEYWLSARPAATRNAFARPAPGIVAATI